MTTQIRVMVVDDHASFRQPLAYMIDREPDCEVTAQAGTLAEARSMMSDVDVAVVDLDLPDGDGVDLVKDLRAVNPHAMVLVLTGSADRWQTARSVEAGASGVLHKSVGIEEILDGIRRLCAGEPLLSTNEIVELLRLAGQQREEDYVARAALSRLTPREREVLQALADGLNDKRIAEHLHISVETVRTHMVNLHAKLGVDSRLQALVFAIRHGAVKVRGVRGDEGGGGSGE